LKCSNKTSFNRLLKKRLQSTKKQSKSCFHVQIFRFVKNDLKAGL